MEKGGRTEGSRGVEEEEYLLQHWMTLRWQVDGPDGLGTVNLKPENLRAPPDISSVLMAGRRLPSVAQVPRDGHAAAAVARARLPA